MTTTTNIEAVAMSDEQIHEIASSYMEATGDVYVSFLPSNLDKFARALLESKQAVPVQDETADGELIADLIEQNRTLRARLAAPASPSGEDAANVAIGEREADYREATKPRPESSGVGEYCQPGDRREPRWIVMYDDADRSLSIFEDEQDARDCFANSEAMGWNCWLFSPTTRAALTAEKVAGQEPFPYQKTFDAIAAATSVSAGRVAISVIKFREAFAAPQPSQPASAVQDDERATFDEAAEIESLRSWVREKYEPKFGKDWPCVLYKVNHGNDIQAAWLERARRAACPQATATQLVQTERALTERLIAAIEGECDGLAITSEQASSIIAYLQYGAPMDDVRRDAERYRKLRSVDINVIHKGGVFAGLTPDNVVINGEDLDIAVDLLIDDAAQPASALAEGGEQSC